MPDIFYDLETKNLLDTSNPDQDAAIKVLRLSVGATWCECHDAQFFRASAPLTEHLLAHPRIIGFNIRRFDNTVLAWSPERPVRETLDPVTGKRVIERPLPDAPEDLKKLLDTRSFDLQADLENRLGHHVSLSALAEATIGKQKSATAAQAVVWNRFAAILRDKWSLALLDIGDQEGGQRANELGRWFQERLEEYCLQDALLVKKIFEFGVTNRRVAFIDFEGERRSIKVQWK